MPHIANLEQRQDFAKRVHTLLQEWARTEDDRLRRHYLVVAGEAVDAALARPLDEILTDEEK